MLCTARRMSANGFLRNRAANLLWRRADGYYHHRLSSKHQRCAASSAFKRLDGSLDSVVDQQSYQANFQNSRALAKKYAELVSVARAGGGEKAVKKHTETNKKLLVRERVRLLLDEGEEFLELSPLSGLGMDYGNIPAAGLVTGIGRVNGCPSMIIANDATVMGGTLFPIGVKKQLRAQEIALHNRLPSFYIVDSGGAFLPLQSEIFPDKEHGGRTFYNQAILSSLGLPQVAIVLGSCTAGGAYVPTMATEAVIVRGVGHIFLGGPPLVQAATGEVVTADELGGADLHCRVSGCTDHYADTEQEGFQVGRNIATTLNLDPRPQPEGYEEPLYDAGELAGLAPPMGEGSAAMTQIVARITDGSRFHEFKAMYGPSLLAGFAHLGGHLVGILANSGWLTHDAALKGAHFVELCCQRSLPLVFLQHTPAAGSDDGGLASGLTLKAQAKMMAAVACAAVPKVTLVVGGCFAPDSFPMCGRSFDPNFLFTWPNAQIALSQASRLAREMTDGDAADPQALAKTTETVQKQSSAFYAESRLWSDGIILPEDTRRCLVSCIQYSLSYQTKRDTQFAVFRM